MTVKLYVLRVAIAEYYPRRGHRKQHVCDRYDDIRYSAHSSILEELAIDLRKKLGTRLWSDGWRKKIRAIWPGYDDDAAVKSVTVVDVTDKVIL